MTCPSFFSGGTFTLPLASHLILTDMPSASPTSAAPVVPVSFAVDMKVISLRTDAVFEDALFIVPPDYHVVAAPASFAFFQVSQAQE